MIVKYKKLSDTDVLLWELYEMNTLSLKITDASGYGCDEMMKYVGQKVQVSFKVGKKRVLVKGRILCDKGWTNNLHHIFYWKFIPNELQLPKMKEISSFLNGVYS